MAHVFSSPARVNIVSAKLKFADCVQCGSKLSALVDDSDGDADVDSGLVDQNLDGFKP